VGDFLNAVGFVLSLIVLVALLASFIGVWIVIADMFTYRGDEWRSAGQPRALWIVLLITINVLVVIPYFLIARPRLRKVRANAASAG